jgi:hypothetical protein
MSKVTSYSKRVLDAAKQLADEQLDVFARAMANNAKSNPDTPRDVPNMIHTINYEVKKMVVYVFTECGYGGWVHEGYYLKNGKKLDGRPFFLWAFDQTVADLS